MSNPRRENMAIRKYESFDQEDYLYQEEIKQNQTPLYQEYLPEAETGPKLSELLFFVNITAFCILTILFSFVFLSFKMHTFFSVGLAVAASLATIQAYRLVMTKEPVDE